MDILEKKVDKRKVFLTIGCAKYPYAKVKELLGDKTYNFKEFSALPIADDEKVIAIQDLGYFSEPFMRMLAFRFAKSTCIEIMPLLSDGEKTLVLNTLEVIRSFLCGEETYENVLISNAKIQQYLDEQLYPKKATERRKQIGCLEILLSVTKWKAKGAMVEASSIQRDILGEEVAAQQLKDIELLAGNLHDIRPLGFREEN